MKKKNEDQESTPRKNLLRKWRERRANSIPPGSAIQSVTAPMPPGEPSPGVPDPASSAGRKDDCGRPTPRIHRKAPIGGPFKPLD
jgi:hypothetical protein